MVPPQDEGVHRRRCGVVVQRVVPEGANAATGRREDNLVRLDGRDASSLTDTHTGQGHTATGTTCVATAGGQLGDVGKNGVGSHRGCVGQHELERV